MGDDPATKLFWVKEAETSKLGAEMGEMGPFFHNNYLFLSFYHMPAEVLDTSHAITNPPPH